MMCGANYPTNCGHVDTAPAAASTTITPTGREFPYRFGRRGRPAFLGPGIGSGGVD